MVAVELHNVTKKFNGVTAVNNINIKIYPGQLFGFLGPNGAGKTTTIKLIVGLLKPTFGYVRVLGVDPIHNCARHYIGYIPDEPIFYENLTAYEFLRFISNIYGVKDASKDTYIDELLELFALDDKKNLLISEFSFGMRHRLSYCCALIHKPPILIIDEPTAGLDPIILKTVKELLKDYIKHNKTVILSTHILSLAEQLCTDIALINHGNLLIWGNINSIKERTKNADLEELFFSLT